MPTAEWQQRTLIQLKSKRATLKSLHPVFALSIFSEGSDRKLRFNLSYLFEDVGFVNHYYSNDIFAQLMCSTNVWTGVVYLMM